VSQDTSKSETTNKKSSPKKEPKKVRDSSADELEDSLTKLDQIIYYYSHLKTRVYRTLISRPKSSKAAKEVIREMKDVIEKFESIYEN